MVQPACLPAPECAPAARCICPIVQKSTNTSNKKIQKSRGCLPVYPAKSSTGPDAQKRPSHALSHSQLAHPSACKSLLIRDGGQPETWCTIPMPPPNAYLSLSAVWRLVVALPCLPTVLVLLLSLPLANLTLAGLVSIELREDEVEDVTVPIYGVSLQALLDVLQSSK